MYTWVYYSVCMQSNTGDTPNPGSRIIYKKPATGADAIKLGELKEVMLPGIVAR